MIIAVLLLGVSVLAGAVFAGGSDAASDEVDELVFDDEEQALISEEARGTIVSFLDDLVTDGEITQGDADTVIEETDFIDGPMNVDAAGGDDGILGSQFADRIQAGEGDDLVYGGAGDDDIRLGAGDDASGLDPRIFAIRPDSGDPTADLGEDFLEGGDDVIRGGIGDDIIADGYGSDQIFGGVGADILISVDQDGQTPDIVDGGFGNDLLIVDEGDTVTTGGQSDYIVIDVFAGIGEDYDVVTITDFDPEKDTIELEGYVGLLLTPAPSGPEDTPENPISVADTEDGTGAIISIGGVPVVVVTGGQGLSVSDVSLSV